MYGTHVLISHFIISHFLYCCAGRCRLRALSRKQPGYEATADFSSVRSYADVGCRAWALACLSCSQNVFVFSGKSAFTGRVALLQSALTDTLCHLAGWEQIYDQRNAHVQRRNAVWVSSHTVSVRMNGYWHCHDISKINFRNVSFCVCWRWRSFVALFVSTKWLHAM